MVGNIRNKKRNRKHKRKSSINKSNTGPGGISGKKGRENMIKMGDRFWDDKNGRYLTVDGVGCDQKCFRCIQEELNDSGDDFEITDTVLMMQNELNHMKKGERMKYILETPDGDRWEYDNLEDARRDQYIFGGTIKTA